MIYVDIDGVLVDSFGYTYKTLREAVHAAGYEVPTSSAYRMHAWGRPWRIVAIWLEACGIEGHALSEIRVDKDRRLEAYLLLNPPEINPILLAMLRDCKLWTACTAGGHHNAALKLARLQMLGLFTMTLSSCDKSDYLFWTAGLGKQCSLLIDDDINNIRAAEAAGKKTIHWRQFH
jgi:beta-phosphoglucomutase-like phosphatase (HAD superfamily)